MPAGLSWKTFSKALPKFLLSDSIRDIEKTLAADGRPVAIGVPGYIVPENIDARLFVKYYGSVQSIAYFVTKPESQVVADMGRFLTTKAWYEDAKDLFHRSPSVMTYDRELRLRA